VVSESIFVFEVSSDSDSLLILQTATKNHYLSYGAEKERLVFALGAA